MRVTRLGPVLFSFAVWSGCFAACPESPGGLLFDLTGPVCTTANQLNLCQCSEGMTADLAAGAEYYEVQRTQRPSGPTAIVGNTKWRNRPAYVDSDGDPEPAYTAPAMWYFAWDCMAGGCFFPQEGMSYDYAMRACNTAADGTAQCSAWAPVVTYPASAYYCYNNGAKVPCY